MFLNYFDALYLAEISLKCPKSFTSAGEILESFQTLGATATPKFIIACLVLIEIIQLYSKYIIKLCKLNQLWV